MTQTTSIDPAEAAHFDKLAHLWWDMHGPFWPLHRINSLRAGYIRDRIAARLGRNPEGTAPLAGVRMLDIGCGGGILSETMARWGGEVHGVDMLEKNIRIASRHAEEMGLAIRYEYGSAEALAERGERYDVVLNLEVVEHVADLSLFMASCSRLVRPGGWMFVSTINRTVASFWGAIVGAEYVLRWLPRGTHHWRKFRKPEELEALLRWDGMEVVERTGMGLNPLNGEFRLMRCMGINYLLWAEKAG